MKKAIGYFRVGRFRGRARISCLILAGMAVLGLTGCAAIAPTSLRVYGEHTSHISQHFGPDSTDYGYNAVNLELHWQHGPAFVDLADGVNVSPLMHGVVGEVHGGLAGPRETFTARAGLEFGL